MQAVCSTWALPSNRNIR